MELFKRDRNQKVSIDYRLFFVYHVAMMILIVFNPFDTAGAQAIAALLLGCVLLGIAFIHKRVNDWIWPGLSPASIPGAILSLLFGYVFLAYASYTITCTKAPPFDIDNIATLFEESQLVLLQAASKPRYTPWYLAGVGIIVFNALSSLNLLSRKEIRTEPTEGDG